jgi:RNA polymerase I-specific transcription initiation factor RRN3
MVKTTYSDDNEHDNNELEDLDAPGSSNAHVEIDINNEDEGEDEDDLDVPMNNMSISPSRSFLNPLGTKSDVGLSMPPRIRPSVSPPS